VNMIAHNRRDRPDDLCRPTMMIWPVKQVWLPWIPADVAKTPTQAPPAL
jgi:hypothetical protein